VQSLRGSRPSHVATVQWGDALHARYPQLAIPNSLPAKVCSPRDSMSAFDFLDGLTAAPAPAPASAPPGSTGFSFLQPAGPGPSNDLFSGLGGASTAPRSSAVEPDLFGGLSSGGSRSAAAGPDLFGGLRSGGARSAPVAPGGGLDDALSSFGLAQATRDAPLPQLAAKPNPALAPPPDFATASAAQLKRFLEARGVDHRTCVEKSELLALARKTACVVEAPAAPAVGSQQPRSTALLQGLGNAFALHGMTHLAPTVAASLDQELEVGGG